jgi:hypothetical protein
MRTRRVKVSGSAAIYHVMSHTVAGTPYLDDRAKEILRKMIWQGKLMGSVQEFMILRKN